MKIIWFCSSLEQKGGGERFALEVVEALRRHGHETLLVCDRLSPAASFDGRYDLSKVVSTYSGYDSSAAYLVRLKTKAAGIFALLRIIRNAKPELILCQSEFDTIKLYLMRWFVNFRYRAFIFGQMYQIPGNIARYSLTFRRHLETIIASRPGYRESVQMPPPRLSPMVAVANEIISWLQRRAHRKADRFYALSTQVAWEAQLVYGRDATIARGALWADYIDQAVLAQPPAVGIPYRFVSLSRLDWKKRIDLIIEGFSRAVMPGTLTIIGTGAEEGRLQALAAASPRADDIHFLGMISDDAVAEQFRQADCLVSMDIGDYDLTVLEAMGKGIRVIVADDFDLASFGDGFTGAKSVAPEASSLAKAMDEIAVMASPSINNLPALLDQTWESLAAKIVAP